ncbi:methyltransferase family protein [Actinoplanes regularis]|uniref:Protein-S-isoprenylcysteine O-methyltransferase Ste14 n=1 Tax=Actinoplanes regularis TaxID=52697 RepID=A0A239C0S4_9ACTN|nr:isoprenylcysteine carboxylmethyltransferase family protein [Actinoplanes regularis]GIE88209.1 membrane protein [Actinoplanes regularis]SNS12983.1 Protein-S-isoprenylcysteine O-methyltransferase Ste14 [Actinoplanes regularis]
MKVFGYAVIAYAAFLSSTVWAIVFLTGPIDGPATRPAWAALPIDAALLLAFAVQHSVMARAGFKRRLTRLIPQPAERGTFVLAASLLMVALFAWWQPVPRVIWQTGSWLWVVYAAGWALAIGSTFMVDHADLVGLKQAYRHLRGQEYRPPEFKERWLYRWCRHPMMLGLVVAFWATPRMTAGHLFFAVAGTAYIMVGIEFEERDLRSRFGTDYPAYEKRVPSLVPWRSRR